MKQESESAVQPRRSLLTALWASLVGLWGSSLAAAASGQVGTKTTPSPAAQEAQVTLIIGRLCLDAQFRGALFASTALDNTATKTLKDYNMNHHQPSVDKFLGEMLAATNSPENPFLSACKKVGDEVDKLPSRGACRSYPC